MTTGGGGPIGLLERSPGRPSVGRREERIYRQSWPTRAAARAAIFSYIEGWYNPRAASLHALLSLPIEFERHHAEVAEPALEGSISDNGSVAAISPKALDGLTTHRVSTVGVDFAPNGLISPKNAVVIQTDSAQAATDVVNRRTVQRRPMRTAPALRRTSGITLPLSFTRPLRRPGARSLTPPGHMAPRGAVLLWTSRRTAGRCRADACGRKRQRSRLAGSLARCGAGRASSERSGMFPDLLGALARPPGSG
jgi:hypothetical protein